MKTDDLIDAIIYMPAYPVALIASNKKESIVPVTYELLSGRKVTLPTTMEVIDNLLFQAHVRAMFSVNQLQSGGHLVVSIHPSDSVITIERRDQ